MEIRTRTIAAACAAVVWLAPGAAHAEKLPAEVIDLTPWKLTLPVARADGVAREVDPPELAGLTQPPFFQTTADGAKVLLRAPCGGAVTKGSKYPRCELREMTPSGEKAAWSTHGATVHRLEWEGAFRHLPTKKPAAVCVQIHDAKDDVLMVRLEGSTLFIERNHAGEEPILTKQYVLGTPFKIRLEAGSGRIRAWYNETLALDWPVRREGCYFKAGCYTQSNVARGDAPEAYGEVEISSLRVTHEP